MVMNALEPLELELDEEDEPVLDPVLDPPEPAEEAAAPVVDEPALTWLPTWPAMDRTVPAEGAVMVVPSTSVCALFTEAWAWVTAS
jgi:hypothetical protein